MTERMGAVYSIALHRARVEVERVQRDWIPAAKRPETAALMQVMHAMSNARRRRGLRGRRVMGVSMIGRDAYYVRAPGYRSVGSAVRAIVSKSIGWKCTPSADQWSGGSHARPVWREWSSPGERIFRRSLNIARQARKAVRGGK